MKFLCLVSVIFTETQRACTHCHGRGGKRVSHRGPKALTEEKLFGVDFPICMQSLVKCVFTKLRTAHYQLREFCVTIPYLWPA